MVAFLAQRTNTPLNASAFPAEHLASGTSHSAKGATKDMAAPRPTDDARYNYSLPCTEYSFTVNDSEAEWFGDGGKNRTALPGQTDFDAFLYIVIVLSFYAISMVLLMIKYIKREEEEVSLDYYYTEFVKRERFQNPRFKNKMALEREKPLIEKAQRLALKTLVNPTQNVEFCRPSRLVKKEHGHLKPLLGKYRRSEIRLFSRAQNVAIIETASEKDTFDTRVRPNLSSQSRGEKNTRVVIPDINIENSGGASPVISRDQQLPFRVPSTGERTGNGTKLYRWCPFGEAGNDVSIATPYEEAVASSQQTPLVLRPCDLHELNQYAPASVVKMKASEAQHENSIRVQRDFAVDIIYTPPETSL